jgi:hypothetical protein
MKDEDGEQPVTPERQIDDRRTEGGRAIQWPHAAMIECGRAAAPLEIAWPSACKGLALQSAQAAQAGEATLCDDQGIVQRDVHDAECTFHLLAEADIGLRWRRGF